MMASPGQDVNRHGGEQVDQEDEQRAQDHTHHSNRMRQCHDACSHACRMSLHESIPNGTFMHMAFRRAGSQREQDGEGRKAGAPAPMMVFVRLNTDAAMLDPLVFVSGSSCTRPSASKSVSTLQTWKATPNISVLQLCATAKASRVHV